MECTHTSWTTKSHCSNCGAVRPEETQVAFKAYRESCRHTAGRTGAVMVCGMELVACVACGATV